MARICLPTTKYLETLPASEPSPEELTFEHLDVDQLAASNQVDRDCRYAQKVERKRKRLFKWAMGRIPADEREAVRLSLDGKSQREIAEIQGISQVQALARLRLAQNRLQWLCNVGSKVTGKQIRKATSGLLRFEDQRILLAWWETGSQSEAALRVYGTERRQKACRDSVLRSKNVLSQIPGLWRISAAVESLWNNAELLLDRPRQKRPMSRIQDLSRPEPIGPKWCSCGNSDSMAGCAEAK